MNAEEARARLSQLQYLKQQVEAEIVLLQRLTKKKGTRVRRTHLEHGTDSGYYWHRTRDIPFPEDEGGEPCGCRRAHTEREKRRAKVRRARKMVGDR